MYGVPLVLSFIALYSILEYYIVDVIKKDKFFVIFVILLLSLKVTKIYTYNVLFI